MSVQRKHLVQRSRNPEQSSPAQGTRQHGSEAPVSMLPPYQPPSCPLTAHSQRQLNHLHVESGTQKYKKHISGALHALQNATADCHERVYVRKEQLEKLSKRKDQDEGLARKYTEREKQSNTLKRQVETITLEAENAVRDLVDYEDELAMQDTIMKDIIKDIREAPTVQPARRPRRVRLDDEASEEDEEEAPTDDPNILSPVELLKKAKEEYASQWGERSMKSRYAENNEYKKFKQGIHNAQYAAESAPPMPHSRTWFPDESGANGSSHRRRNNTTDHTSNNDEESDDDVQVSAATTVLKCPLTLKTFEQPYSNNICKHTFEKFAIIEYINHQGVMFHASQTARAARTATHKQAKCPQAGCEKMLALKDFYDDSLLLRQIQRIKQKASRDYDDDDPDEEAPRGTQRNRPEQIDDDDDSDGVDVDETAGSAKLAKIKRERHQSRGHSTGPSRGRFSEPDDDEDMDDV